jgi:hypothetical protein
VLDVVVLKTVARLKIMQYVFWFTPIYVEEIVDDVLRRPVSPGHFTALVQPEAIACRVLLIAQEN